MGNILQIESANWKEIESSAKPVFVDFWAEWCGPCRALAPTFEKLAAAYGSEFLFAKANVDAVPEIADRFRVQAIPTLLLLKGGQPVETLIGYHSFEELEKVLARHVTPATVK